MSKLDIEQLGHSSLESPNNGTELSESDEPKVVTEEPAESESPGATFLTSRKELWAFYLYYAVRSVQNRPAIWEYRQLTRF